MGNNALAGRGKPQARSDAGGREWQADFFNIGCKDKHGGRLQKKDLGAFYTPAPYCEKAAELVRMAIGRVPEGNDYVILDRCAGTGNLESALTCEELSHCILSAYDCRECKALRERLGGKARLIIPPAENLAQCDQGMAMNADALSESYIKNESIAEYLRDGKCTVIMLENPPYQDSSAITFADESGRRAKASRADSFVLREFKKAMHEIREQRGAAREISNLFIWSAFRYYLRQPADSYICFSPVKYFKSVGLVRKEFIKGFLFNRKHFNATPSAVSCILWANIPADRHSWTLEAYDINKDGKLEYVKDVAVREVRKPVHAYNDRRAFADDAKSRIVAAASGEEKAGWSHEKKFAVSNPNIIGYMAANGYSIDAKHRYLMRLPYYVGVEQSFGFYLRRDNYIGKLPVFCAKLYPQKNWYEKDVYFTSSDRGEEYLQDEDLLRSCLIHVCLCEENRCRTIRASDGVVYQNELCLDDGTKALQDLRKFRLAERDEEMLAIWRDVLSKARQADEYKEDCKYGTFQIRQELDAFRFDGGKKAFIYPELHGGLAVLKKKLRKYYEEIIQPLLFRHELIK